MLALAIHGAPFHSSWRLPLTALEPKYLPRAFHNITGKVTYRMLGIAVTFIVCLVPRECRVSVAIRQACLRVSCPVFRDPPTHTLGLGTANKFHFIPNNNGRSQGEAILSRARL